MTHTQLKIHIDAPIERVFELATDFRRYPEWNVNYREVRDVAGSSQHVGTRIYGVLAVVGHAIQGWSELVELDAPRLVRLAGGGEGGTLNVLYRLTPLETGTDVTCDIEYELPARVFAGAMDPLFLERTMERDLRHSAENFEALLGARIPILA